MIVSLTAAALLVEDVSDIDFGPMFPAETVEICMYCAGLGHSRWECWRYAQDLMMERMEERQRYYDEKAANESYDAVYGRAS